MGIFTSGYELLTALTNVLIFIISFILFLKIKKNNGINKLWILFYLLISISGFLGFIIHGIKFQDIVIDFLWMILSFVFSLVINTLIMIFFKVKKKPYLKVFILSILLYTIMFIQIICKVEFLYTFIIYSAISLLLCIFMIIKNKLNIYYLIGIAFQFFGGIFLLFPSIKLSYLLLDKNGIYHLFVIITILLFYKANEKAS